MTEFGVRRAKAVFLSVFPRQPLQLEAVMDATAEDFYGWHFRRDSPPETSDESPRLVT